MDETNQFIGMNYIAGFCPTRADFSGFNFKNESTGCFPQSTKEEVDEAIDRVEKSFEFWNSQNDKSFYFEKIFQFID